jgi:hypothetical protein
VTSHVEQQIAARIARARAGRAQQAAERAERAERRAHGLTARHAAKLRHLAERDVAEPEQPEQGTAGPDCGEAA